MKFVMVLFVRGLIMFKILVHIYRKENGLQQWPAELSLLRQIPCHSDMTVEIGSYKR
jgi:hypothetical protein